MNYNNFAVSGLKTMKWGLMSEICVQEAAIFYKICVTFFTKCLIFVVNCIFRKLVNVHSSLQTV